MQEGEREQLAAITAQSFAIAADRLAMHTSTPIDECWVAVRGGRIEAALRAERVGQFLGGRVVSVAAISAVQTAADRRGTGVGKALLSGVQQALRSEGVSVSLLYPATIRPYRAVGYEFAGAYVRYRLPIHAIPRVPPHQPVEPWDGSALPEIQECYRQFAELSHGLLSRSPRWWERRILAESPNRPQYRYLVRSNDRVTGYIIYTHRQAPGDLDYSYTLTCHDLVWLDYGSARALLALAASHGAVGVDLLWTGPVEEPLFGCIDSVEIRIAESSRWMAQLVDVKAALEARGYPRTVRASVTLRVLDRQSSWNEGTISLEIADGEGSVSRADGRAAEVDVGTLAALFTGWLPARDAVRCGGLRGADPVVVATLEAIFGGPKPWMQDRF